MSKGGVRRMRDRHPLLESCRSVYCYEVSRPPSQLERAERSADQLHARRSG